MRTIRSAVLAGAALLVAACDEGQPPAFIVADSAGVQLIDVAWEQAPVDTVAATPDLVIGDGQGFDGLELFGVRHLAVATDSALLVADRDQRILRIDPRTRTVTRIGRAGDGPVEFRSLSRVLPTPRGDVLAVDSRRHRVVEVTVAGELIREARLPVVAPPGGTVRVLAGGPPALETLHLAIVPGFEANTSGRPHRGVGAIVGLTEPTDTLAVFRGPSTFAGRGATGAVVFGASTLFAGSDDGIWLGDTGDRKVELWRRDHGLAAVVRWSHRASRDLTDARIAEFWSRIESRAHPEQRAAIPQMKKILPFADSLPAFGSLVVTPPYVWIGAARDPEIDLLELPAPPQEWLVVDYRAARARRLVTPAAFTPAHATEKHVVGVHRDALGVETVRRYPLPDGSWLRESGTIERIAAWGEKEGASKLPALSAPTAPPPPLMRSARAHRLRSLP